MAPSITNKTGGRRVRRLADVSAVKVM
jgi:hypothetical protein